MSQSAMRWGLLVFSSVVLVCAATYKLSEAPAFWYDEGLYTQAAENLNLHGVGELQIAPQTFTTSTYLTVGFTLLVPVSLAYKWFGYGVFQGRVVMVLYIMLFAAAAYVLGRMLYGRWFAAWALLLLVSFPILYGDGKSVLGEVPGMLFLVLTFISLLWLERSNFTNAWSYIFIGLFGGLCVITKPIFILLLPAVAIAWAFRWKSIQIHWGGFLLALAAFAIPVAIWAEMQFGGTATFAKQSEYYFGSPYATTDHLRLAITNALQFVTQSTPIYTALTIILWAVSLLIRKKHATKIMATEIAMFSFCILILAAYLRIQGWYRYFFPAELLALLTVPYTLATVFTAKTNFWVRKLPYALLLLLALVQLYQLANGSYVAGYYRSSSTADLYSAFAALGKDKSFFLANVPEVAIFLPSDNYYQYVDAAQDLRIGAEEVALLENGTADYVVVNPGTYAQDTQLFKAYSRQSAIGKYLLLSR